MSDDTIIGSSPTGKRLKVVQQDKVLTIVFSGRKIPLIGKIVVGRERSCDLVLEGSLVSKRHALIQKIKDNFYITDLSSTNGTFVNEEPVLPHKYVRIEPGDCIRIGKTLLSLK